MMREISQKRILHGGARDWLMIFSEECSRSATALTAPNVPGVGRVANGTQNSALALAVDFRLCLRYSVML
jgi:hypothetical protein